MAELQLVSFFLQLYKAVIVYRELVLLLKVLLHFVATFVAMNDSQ